MTSQNLHIICHNLKNVVVELIIEITWFAFGQSDFLVRLNDKTDKQNNCWQRPTQYLHKEGNRQRQKPHVHTKTCIILLNANMHSVLDHFSIDFKLLYLWLEVVMRFKALGNESNIICCVVNITSHYH